jgi:hypothetical protein
MEQGPKLHIIHLEKLLYGLSRTDLRGLAFELAEVDGNY